MRSFVENCLKITAKESLRSKFQEKSFVYGNIVDISWEYKQLELISLRKNFASQSEDCCNF